MENNTLIGEALDNDYKGKVISTKLSENRSLVSYIQKYNNIDKYYLHILSADKTLDFWYNDDIELDNLTREEVINFSNFLKFLVSEVDKILEGDINGK